MTYIDWPTPEERGWYKLYTAGPMTGHDLFNWPMFERRAKIHRRQGHWIVCPTEIDEESGMVIVKRASDGTILSVEQSDSFDYEQILALDLEAIYPGRYEGFDNPWGPSVVPCDGIVLLPGWRSSSGAKRELVHAEKWGLRVFEGNVPNATTPYNGWPEPTIEQWSKAIGLPEPVPDVAGRDIGPFGAGFSRFKASVPEVDVSKVTPSGLHVGRGDIERPVTVTRDVFPWEREVTVHDTLQTVRIDITPQAQEKLDEMLETANAEEEEVLPLLTAEQAAQLAHMFDEDAARVFTDLPENTPQQESESIDQFDTGATRNASGHKHDYEGFLSFRVIRRYGEYMHKNRHLADGSIRDSDNWQNGIPVKRYVQSLWRHLVDAWEIYRRSLEVPEIEVVIKDFDGKEVDIEEALCGVIFNASGLLDSVIRNREVGVDPRRKYGRP